MYHLVKSRLSINLRCTSLTLTRNTSAGSGFNRSAATGKSLDLALLANESGLVISHLRARRSADSIFEQVNRIGALRAERSSKIMEGNDAKNRRNVLSAQIGKLLKETGPGAGANTSGGSGVAVQIESLKEQVLAASALATVCDESLGQIDLKIYEIMSSLPNLLDDEVPDGSDDVQNVQVRAWGCNLRKLGAEGMYRWHDEVALLLGGIDSEAAAKISGARFTVLVGQLARLERALMSYCLDFHGQRGYVEVAVPYVVSRSTLEGTGQLPKFEEDLFKTNHSVAGEDAFLIPTAEVPVTSLYRGRLLEASQLPIRHVCGSPCFRAEAGSNGRDTRGLLRQHQFHKVELVKIVEPQHSQHEHEQMLADAEAVLQSLQLPYRTMLLCSGDTGFSARKCYDIEVWLPGQQKYREISSVSNCHDFQSRRMALRYRPDREKHAQGVPARSKGAKPTAYPHTLNGSGLAIGRTLVAILENHQQPDGSVSIPLALQPYMGGQTVLNVATKNYPREVK